MKAKYPIDFIGNTPMMEISELVPDGGAQLFAKLEFTNPGGSIKDRPALAMVLDGFERGLLKPEMEIVEPTAGNTGIGLALVAKAYGLTSMFFVPERMSQEKIQAIQICGGRVELVPTELGMTGCIEACEDYMKQREGCYMPQQFENPANPRQAETILAAEIERDLGQIPDGIAIGAGTGGTFTGVARYMKARSTNTRCVVVEPVGSIFGGGPKGDYRTEGIGNSYIPGNLELSLADDIATIPDRASFGMCAAMRQLYGLGVGGSSGANVAAAVQLCKRLGKGKKVVTVLCDGMERYRSKKWVQELLKGDYDGSVD